MDMDFSLIGLSGRDKRVYEYLLQHPESSVRGVAEGVAINRGSVYESIKDLVAAGLATHIMTGKRPQYRAKDPEILHEIIHEKRRKLVTLLHRSTRTSLHLPDRPTIHHAFTLRRFMRATRDWRVFCVMYSNHAGALVSTATAPSRRPASVNTCIITFRTSLASVSGWVSMCRCYAKVS